MKNLSLALITLALVTSCGNNEKAIKELSSSEDEQSVIKPIEGLVIPIQHFTINASKGDSLILPNCGSIIISKNAFVDLKGNPIKGKVDVEWQEFHSLGEIIASGIPMKYDSAGVENDFESGGMFTISASQNNETVQLAPGKSAKVNLASIQDTPCYNFYELDERTGDWSYITTESSEPIEQPVEKVGEVEELTDVQSQTILDVDLDTRKFPELQELEIVGWKPKERLSEKSLRKLQMRNAKLRLVQTSTNELAIELITKKDTTNYLVEPYLVEQAMVDSKSKLARMNEEMAEAKKYEDAIEKSVVMRSIEIENFGTYNWDRIYKLPNVKQVVAHYDFPKRLSSKLISLYLISPDDNAVIKCDASGGNTVLFEPSRRNCWVAIFPDNELFVVSNEGFNEARVTENGDECTFTFEKTGIILQSPRDITNYLKVLI